MKKTILDNPAGLIRHAVSLELEQKKETINVCLFLLKEVNRLNFLEDLIFPLESLEKYSQNLLDDFKKELLDCLRVRNTYALFEIDSLKLEKENLTRSVDEFEETIKSLK